jgi:hypothetical protein
LNGHLATLAGNQKIVIKKKFEPDEQTTALQEDEMQNEQCARVYCLHQEQKIMFFLNQYA